MRWLAYLLLGVCVWFVSNSNLGSVLKKNEASSEVVFRGRRVFICLLDNGDR